MARDKWRERYNNRILTRTSRNTRSDRENIQDEDCHSPPAMLHLCLRKLHKKMSVRQSHHRPKPHTGFPDQPEGWPVLEPPIGGRTRQMARRLADGALPTNTLRRREHDRRRGNETDERRVTRLCFYANAVNSIHADNHPKAPNAAKRCSSA